MGIIKQILSYFLVFRKYIGNRLYIVLLLSLLATLTEGLGIMMLLPLIDASGVMVSASPHSGRGIDGFLSKILAAFGVESSMVGILIFIGFIMISKGIIHFCALGYQAYLRTELMLEIKTKLFQKYTGMKYSHYLQYNTGHYVNIINLQSGKMIVSFENFKQFMVSILTASAYILTVFFVSWRFAVMAGVAGVGLLLLFRGLNHQVHMLSRRTSSEFTVLNKLLVQMMQSFKYLLATAQQGHLRVGFLKSVKLLATDIRKQGLLQALTVSLAEPVAISFVLAVIILQVAVYQASLGPIFVALILFNRAMGSMMGIQQAWQLTLDKIGGLEMVEKEFDLISERQEQSGPVKLNNVQHAIELRNVCFRYRDSGVYVLDDVSLTIKANSSVAFVGESGAGKTTLVDVLTLILRPQSGEVLIDGVDSTEVALSSWREQIGYVSQETVVFDDTIANNICLWQGDITRDEKLRDRIAVAAKQAYADHFITELPEQYNTMVGDRGVRLSGGQRQRLFLARELFKNPRLFILDEATSALDSESEGFIKQSVDALKGVATIIIIAHRLATIKDVDYIYVLDGGRVVEHGSYMELFSRPGGRFKEMVDLQKL